MGIVSSPLARPVYIGKRIVKNRFMIQPMECGDSDLRGGFTEDTLRRYENLFRGGAGMVVMESVTLQYNSRSTKHQLLLNVKDPVNRSMWETFVRDKKVRFPNTLLIVQLNHSGELSNPEFSQRVCVKPLAGFGGTVVDEDYMDEVIASYAEAARFLAFIGVDGVDLKFCHGYLGSQVVRPYNDRLWKYGGSFENRASYAFEMCEQVRYAVPDERFLIGAKISLYDEMLGGQGHIGLDNPNLDVIESVRLCQGLENRGASFFIESLGNAGLGWKLMCPSHDAPDVVYQHINAAKILRQYLRPESTVICSGLSLVRNGRNNGLGNSQDLFEVGNAGIQSHAFDMIGLGRQSFADPALPYKYLNGQKDTINWCTCCNHCGDLFSKEIHAGCAVYNPPYVEAYRHCNDLA